MRLFAPWQRDVLRQEPGDHKPKDDAGLPDDDSMGWRAFHESEATQSDDQEPSDEAEGEHTDPHQRLHPPLLIVPGR